MVHKVICSNTAPIWHLAKIKEIKTEWNKYTDFEVTTNLDIDSLKEVYKKIIIPEKVQEEIEMHRRCPQIAKDFITQDIVRKVSVGDQAKVEYLLNQYMGGKDSLRNRGECETFVLASEQGLSALLANDGAEDMFDRENRTIERHVEYISLIPFGKYCLQQGLVKEEDFTNFLKILKALNYKPNKHENIFREYGIELGS